MATQDTVALHGGHCLLYDFFLNQTSFVRKAGLKWSITMCVLRMMFKFFSFSFKMLPSTCIIYFTSLVHSPILDFYFYLTLIVYLCFHNFYSFLCLIYKLFIIYKLNLFSNFFVQKRFWICVVKGSLPSFYSSIKFPLDVFWKNLGTFTWEINLILFLSFPFYFTAGEIMALKMAAVSNFCRLNSDIQIY